MDKYGGKLVLQCAQPLTKYGYFKMFTFLVRLNLYSMYEEF